MLPYLDWVAVGFTVAQMYFLGHRRVVGWPLGLVACALWIAWAGSLGLWSIVAINLLLAGFVLRGWRRWSSPPAEGGAPALIPVALGAAPPGEAGDEGGRPGRP